MTIDTEGIIKLMVDLMGDHQIKVTVAQSAKGGAITGVCTVVGGLVAGPIGLAIGGGTGGILSYLYTKDTFKSVTEIFMEMPAEKKIKIAAEIVAILKKLEVKDFFAFLTLVEIYKNKGSINKPDDILIKSFIKLTIPVVQKFV